MKLTIKYEALCTEDDCFNVVKTDDLEIAPSGRICPRSQKCWDCRTVQDKKAIKRFRSKNREISTL